MANTEKCATGPEATNDALNAIVNKALGYPKKGTRVGGGIFPTISESWDGQGEAPFGWTKQATAVYVVSALDTALPLPDDLVAQLQAGPAQAALSGPEKATLNAAIATRTVKDLEAGGYRPKANPALGAGEKAKDG